ncbi:hypothetical protein [uncultured Methanobrevibacter sp.]|uniref:hypothetical protein n=1 Tax=uncultured Methanobrevibacter sp. TaxID=253161 RepID=UPI00260649CB
MKKNIFLIALILIAVVAVSGCINSPIDNINNNLKELNTDISEGDNDYNSAINFINSRDYSSGSQNIQIAKDKFDDASIQIQEIEENENSLNESVYKDYIDLIKEEVSLKKQASDQLYLALQYYTNNDISSGNSYATSANSLMNQAVILQNQRNAIVDNNTELFKKAGII